jgi:asparagine synthase (glutamine-hydrolysing)
VTLKGQPVSESLFNPGFVADLRRVSETYDEERYALTRQSFITFRQMPWFAHGRMASEQGQLTIRNPFLDNEFVKAAYRVPPELAESLEMALRIIADGNEMLSKFPIDRGYMLGGNPVAARIREKFQRFTFRAEYAYDYGMPPWLLKMDNALARLRLSRQFLGRHKFYHFRTWYRNELSQYVKDVLLDPRTLARPYLNGPRVEQIVKAHTTGAGNHTVEIHKLLTAELIQRQLIEQN